MFLISIERTSSKLVLGGIGEASQPTKLKQHNIKRKEVPRVKITSSYKMKLSGDLKALEDSIKIYREALQMLIPIIDSGWKILNMSLLN